VAGADLPPTGGGGPPVRVHELGGLESQGFTFRSGNVLRGAPPPLSQISVRQVTEVPADLNVVARGDQAVTDVTYRHAACSDPTPNADRAAAAGGADLSHYSDTWWTPGSIKY